MRHIFPTAVLLSLLLSACASAPKPSKAVDQSGTLKVHPGLLGQPVPPELAPQDVAPRRAPAAPDTPAAPAVIESNSPKIDGLKVDEAGLQTQRSIYFDLNSAELKAEYSTVVQTHASYLSQHPKARIRVEGNADERGPSGHNQKLGLKRAETLKQALLARGAAGKQIKVTSLGATNPKKKGHDEESWAENRRADIVYEKD